MARLWLYRLYLSPLVMHGAMAHGYGAEVAHAAGLRKEARGNHLPRRAEGRIPISNTAVITKINKLINK